MVKTKILGIVFVKKTDEKVEGYLAKWRTETKQGELIKDELIKIYFEYIPETGIYTLPIGHIEDAKEIGRQLKGAGYKNVKLLFNDKEYEIN